MLLWRRVVRCRHVYVRRAHSRQCWSGVRRSPARADLLVQASTTASVSRQERSSATRARWPDSRHGPRSETRRVVPRCSASAAGARVSGDAELGSSRSSRETRFRSSTAKDGADACSNLCPLAGAPGPDSRELVPRCASTIRSLPARRPWAESFLLPLCCLFSLPLIRRDRAPRAPPPARVSKSIRRRLRGECLLGPSDQCGLRFEACRARADRRPEVVGRRGLLRSRLGLGAPFHIVRKRRGDEIDEYPPEVTPTMRAKCEVP